VASLIIERLGSQDEKMRIYKDVVKNIIESEDVKDISEVGGSSYVDVLLDFKLSEGQKTDLRELFYRFMESENEAVRKKALCAYQVFSSRL
jgi:HEAT repeat protein